MPDKGAGYGQALRPRGVRKSWEALQRFLTQCAVASSPGNMKLTAYRATQWDDDAVANDCISGVIAHFGAPHHKQGGARRWPSGEPLKGGQLEWDCPAARVRNMITFLAAGEPWPKQTLGPVELTFSVRFVWRDPSSDRVLPGQTAGHGTPDSSLHSSLLLTFGRRCFVQPTLWFPFPEGAPGLSDFLRAITPYLPFTLLRRHFRVATPIHEGKHYQFRRLVMPLLTTT